MSIFVCVGGFLCSVLIILWGCSVFTNAVEWLGKQTKTPELANSVLWLQHKKDTLAISIITGAMVFQGRFPWP